MKKLITIALTLLVALTIVGCVDKTNKETEQPTTPVEPETLEIVFDSTITQNTIYNLVATNTNYTKATIRVFGGFNETSDLPLNIISIKLNETIYTFENSELSTSYSENETIQSNDKDFLVNLVNKRGTDLGLHNYHKDKGTDGFVSFDIAGINNIEISFKITTAAFKYFTKLVITLEK